MPRPHGATAAPRPGSAITDQKYRSRFSGRGPYDRAMIEAMTACPACGGSGGGPFGPRGSAWDDESYECPRCLGAGVVAAGLAGAAARPLAKGAARRPELAAERRGPVSTRPAGPAAAGAGAAANGSKK